MRCIAADISSYQNWGFEKMYSTQDKSEQFLQDVIQLTNNPLIGFFSS